MSEEKLYIDDGELIYYINENEFISCDEIPMSMLEGIKHLQQKVEQQEKEIDRLNNIIDELENTIANFMENHTEGYLDWKYDREIYLAESNVLQKLYDTYFDKLQELKEE